MTEIIDINFQSLSPIHRDTMTLLNDTSFMVIIILFM